jgi:hypothetical protein
MAQELDHLPSKYKVLSSDFIPWNKQINKHIPDIFVSVSYHNSKVKSFTNHHTM